MAVLTTAPGDAAALTAAASDPQHLVVVSLCAAWCDVCREFRAAYERIAAARAGITFVWLDIEDDSDACGAIDVENFPTLAIYCGSTPVHFGVSLPHEGTVARLIDVLAVDARPQADVPEGVRELPATLAGR